MEDGFDRAILRTGADERLVRALAEHQLERTDDDGFAGARLARDGGGTGTDRPFQFIDEREIPDAKG